MLVVFWLELQLQLTPTLAHCIVCERVCVRRMCENARWMLCRLCTKSDSYGVACYWPSLGRKPGKQSCGGGQD